MFLYHIERSKNVIEGWDGRDPAGELGLYFIHPKSINFLLQVDLIQEL